MAYATIKAEGNLIIYTTAGGTGQSFSKEAYKKHTVTDGWLRMVFMTTGQDLITEKLDNLLIGDEEDPITDEEDARTALKTLFPDAGGSGGSATLPVYNASTYSVLPDGTDCTSAMNALLATWYAGGGGTIQFGPGTYRFNGQLLIPNNEATLTVPNQPPLKIVGSGSGDGNRTVLIGGTILDVRFIGDDETPFIDTRGTGKLEITGIGFLAGIDIGNTPFIKTTNTRLIIENNAFWGFNQGLAANQDAIILGGVNGGSPGGEVQAPFQGYGTIIINNFFQNIKRGVFGKRYCNGNVISGNTFWLTCGGTGTNAAIYFNSYDLAQSDAGNIITNNLFEMPTYEYGIYLEGVNSSTIIGNNFYDQGVGTIAGIYLAENSAFNLVQEGLQDDVITTKDMSGANTIIRPGQGQTSVYPNKLSVGTELSTTNGQGTVVKNPSGQYHSFDTDNVNGVNLVYKPVIGSVEYVLQFQRITSTNKRMTLLGTDNSIIGNGTLRVNSDDGGTLFVGGASHYWYNGVFYIRNGLSTKIAVDSYLGWGNDLTLGRPEANVLSINTDANNDATGSVYAKIFKTTPLTFATLPASPLLGMVAAITDCNTTTWGANAAGGGSNKAFLFYNGTNWTVMGK